MPHNLKQNSVTYSHSLAWMRLSPPPTTSTSIVGCSPYLSEVVQRLRLVIVIKRGFSPFLVTTAIRI